MTLTDTAATELRAALLKAAAALEVKQGPTVESVYGKPLGELTAPEGWELTGEFRILTPWEPYLSPALPPGTLCRAYSIPNEPRLILRKKEPPKPRRFVFEFVRRGKAQKGEWYQDKQNTFWPWTFNHETALEYDIYRLVEESE